MLPIRFTPKDTDVRRIAELWHSSRPRRGDETRSDETLKWLITTPSVSWYRGPKSSLWYLTDQNASIQSATLDVLACSVWVFRNATPFLTKLMELEDLRKLYILCPSSARSVKRLAKMVGFRHEGALKEGIKFDGRYVSLEIFGLLAKEVGKNGNRKTKKEGRPRPRKGHPRWQARQKEASKA